MRRSQACRNAGGGAAWVWLLALSIIHARAAACPDSGTWVPGSNGRCYKITTTWAAHWQCEVLCAGEDNNASLACISSAEENEVVAGLVSGPLNAHAHRLWIGHYQHLGAMEPSGGWGLCSSGEAATGANWTGANWMPGEPNEEHAYGEDCVAVYSGQSMLWFDVPCSRPLRCLCEHGASASPEYAASATEQRARLATRTWLMFLLVVLFSLAPLLLFCCYSRLLRPCLPPTTTSASTTFASITSAEDAAHPPLRRDSTTSAVATLAAAERANATLRMRVSGTIALAGWSLIVLGATPFGAFWVLQMDLSATAGSFSYYTAAFAWGLPLFLLALRPTDARAIASVCRFGFASVLAAIPLSIFLATVSLIFMGDFFVFGSCLAAILLLLTSAGLIAPTVLTCATQSDCASSSVFAMTPRRRLRRLWQTARFALSCGAAILSTLLLARALHYGAATLEYPHTRGLIVSNASCLLSAIVFAPATRGRVHRWLGQLGKQGTKEQEAAAVASLIGGGTGGGVAKAMATAQAKFRVLPLASLTADDLASNADTGLNARVRPARLGECEAFMSHSWQDDGAKKFARLHEHAWGATEPTIWLDKACIPQTDIDASLAVLPIFLAGCQQLLVILGPSYPTRLWCVMELFVFLRMGGQRSDMVVKLLDESAEAGLRRFDAAKARCYHDVDRQKLLAVIEAAFGSFQPFNKIVCGVFQDSLILNVGTKDPGAMPTKYQVTAVEAQAESQAESAGVR